MSMTTKLNAAATNKQRDPEGLPCRSRWIATPATRKTTTITATENGTYETHCVGKCALLQKVIGL